MAVTDIGVNIRRYMKMRNYTNTKLAKACELGPVTISHLVNGISTPTTSTLLKISSVLDVPLQKLLADTPHLKAFRFRTNASLSGPEKAKRDEVLQEATQWLEDYHLLEDLTGESSPFLLDQNYAGVEPEKVASQVRKQLRLSEEDPIVDIVLLFENAGIKTKIVSFGFKKTFGISFGREDGGPAIWVNSYPGISIERQIFTMAHELGHLLMHLPSYDGKCEAEDPKEEKEADQFASYFLMPQKAFEKKWNEYQGISWIDTVLSVKHVFSVSYQTVLYRYAQDQSNYSYQDLVMQFAQAYKVEYGHDLKNHYEPEAIESLPFSRSPRFSRLARKALEEGDISVSKVAQMLDIDTTQMRELVASWK